MSWPLAAYGLLAVALAAGFAWYERTRPDARVVALVGTLAAFAALGRIAFAAVPNVKPTTDIVLIAGYTLGGGPGFVVGAVAALTSNLFFGQGPWTPWQMAGWGATGVIGAALAIPTRGRIGRWPLALVCFAVGFAFTVLQDFGDWVTYSAHSLAQLSVYVGQGIGFDFIHATGCLVFALAFGPALGRSLQRFRTRLEVRWVAPAGAALLAAALALHAVAPAPAQAASSPVSYLLGAQNRDGGFGAAPGSPSSSLFSGWAALGLAAAGTDPATTSHGGPTLLSYLVSNPGTDPGSLERSILAIRAGGGQVTGLLARLRDKLRADGSVSEQTNLTAFAVLALRAAGTRPPGRTIGWLVRQQDADGGFNFATRGGASDVDDTGAVLEALAGTGHAAAAGRAVKFIRAQQNRDGGYPSSPGGSSNAQSTAFAVEGLIAAGASPRQADGYLRSLTAPDGHVRYARGTDQTPVWVTAQAELALAGRPLPLAAPRRVAVVPVASKPPARKLASGRPTPRPRARIRARARHAPRRSARAVDLGVVVTDAGALAAIALAPVGL